ncbi:hypothetical protein K457DRAFT_205941 [Linnemannia elongata AG-77]|uniref:Plectin/eS10 N-terminal domain-containing protein n=1 Tax=Linnemannia elongata AG-77 TaxID=1314771 RepID=A0A197JG35_9FUNG|nr:hypothetical protein K457DRAFT_205941 [Linnemannia elongata AG-77]
MLIPKQNRKLIYEALFKDGVLVAKKDFNAPKHDEIDVPNLQVIKALQSLDSKQFVKTQFSWQYYYYTLTDAGIEYLREYLHLPSEIFPATFKKTARPSAPRRAGNDPALCFSGYPSRSLHFRQLRSWILLQRKRQSSCWIRQRIRCLDRHQHTNRLGKRSFRNPVIYDQSPGPFALSQGLVLSNIPDSRDFVRVLYSS